ncbi:MAG: DNA-binding protein [Gammaproteobacteria bacterium]|nr:DNA-binding protein [Gammaproteobacteria bacterium]
MTTHKLTRIQLLNEFESAPHSALFNQNTLAAILNCSTQLLERNRWAGEGVPYIKIGRKVLYRKREVLDFIQRQKTYHSTSDAGHSTVCDNNLV